MSQETVLDVDLEQSRQGSPNVAVEDATPSGAVAAGPDEPGRAQAVAQVAQGGPAEGKDSQPSSSRAAPDSSESSGQNSEADSQSAQVGDEGGALAESASAPDTSLGDLAPDPHAAPDSSEGTDARAFSARQVGAARRFGLLEEDLVVLEALGRTGRGLLERLAKADSDLSRRYSRLGRAEQSRQGSPDQPGNAPAPPSEEGGAKAASVVCPPGFAKDMPGKNDGQTTTPAARDSLKERSTFRRDVAPVAPAAPAPGTAPNLAEELARLRGQVSQLLRETQEALAARESADAERFFTRLDPGTYPEIAGGPTEKLADDSPQRKSRQALLVKAREIRSGHEAVHGDPMEVEESLQEALTVLAPGAAAQAERKKLWHQLRLREAGLIARPTQRSGGAALESPADRTARALEDWQSRRGVRFFED